MKEIIQILLIELVVLAILVRMGRSTHYIVVLVASLVCYAAYLMLGKGEQVLGKDASSLLVPGLLLAAAGQFLWILVRNPALAIDALDTHLMQESVAKQLARNERGPAANASYGNWRVAQEIVRKLKGRDKE